MLGVRPFQQKIQVRQFLSVIKLFVLGACVAGPQLCSVSQEVSIPTDADLSRQPGLVSDWSNRLLAVDPRTRAAAAAVLVQGGTHSLPLLTRFLRTSDEHLHVETFGIVRR